MAGKRRRTGVAAWVVVALTAIASPGCVGALDQVDRQAARGTGPDPTAGSRDTRSVHNPACAHCKNYNGHLPPGSGQPGSGLQQAGYPGNGPGVLLDNGAMALLGQGQPGPGPLPRELVMASHPPYTVAPPDILFIDTLRLVPRPPYRLEALEVLLISVADTLPNQPIAGPFSISPEGYINLGFNYGSVFVLGMTLEQARGAIGVKLLETIRDPLSPKDRPRSPQVNIALAQFRGMQQIRGEHLVRPDGTISLGAYGSVYVAGMTLGQVKWVVEKHLSEYLVNPQLSVDVFAYNSKKYYVIVDGAGFGQLVFSFPCTGNETVLDAITSVNGLAPSSSKKRIWLARPSPVHLGCNQVLPVDWNAITQGASTRTNYQLFPGDRVYIQGDCWIAFDNYLSKILAPIERVLGITFLGASTVDAVSGGGGSTRGVVVVP